MKHRDFALSGFALKWWAEEGAAMEKASPGLDTLDIAIELQRIEDAEGRGLEHSIIVKEAGEK